MEVEVVWAEAAAEGAELATEARQGVAMVAVRLEAADTVVAVMAVEVQEEAVMAVGVLEELREVVEATGEHRQAREVALLEEVGMGQAGSAAAEGAKQEAVGLEVAVPEAEVRVVVAKMVAAKAEVAAGVADMEVAAMGKGVQEEVEKGVEELEGSWAEAADNEVRKWERKEALREVEATEAGAMEAEAEERGGREKRVGENER